MLVTYIYWLHIPVSPLCSLFFWQMKNDKHNHVPDVTEILVKEVMVLFRQKAQTLMDTPVHPVAIA